MTLGETLWDYFRKCPLIDQQNRLNFNALGAEPSECTIEDTPENPILQQYMDGSTVRAKTFVLGSRLSYGLDARMNIESSGAFEALRRWIEQQNRAKQFPALEEGRRALKLEALTDGYLFTSEEDTARYQIQLRLTYFEKGER